MKRSQHRARRIQNGLVCGLLLLGCCTMLPGCGKKSDDSGTKSESSRNKRSDYEISSAAKGLALSLIRDKIRIENQRQGYSAYLQVEKVKFEKIRQSPDDPDTYFAKAVSTEGKKGMWDVKIEFAGGMVQVTLLE